MEPVTQNSESLQTDGGYGWVCVAACWIFNAFTWGGVSSYGVYLSYYLSHQSYPDASDVDFAFIGGLNISMAMVVAPLATYLARGCGPRRVMVAGALLQTTGFITASFGSQVWHLYLSQGISIGVGIGLIYIPSLPVISQWFSTRRSLANGLSASGSGFGGTLFSWLRRVDMLLLLSWSFLSMLGYVVLLFSLPDFATSIGLTQTQATDIAGFLNLGTAIGRPIIGTLSDRYNRIGTATMITLICSLSCIAIWLPATSYALAVFFSIICGATLGVFWMTIGPLCVEVAGLKELQSLLSLAWISVIIPTTC